MTEISGAENVVTIGMAADAIRAYDNTMGDHTWKMAKAILAALTTMSRTGAASALGRPNQREATVDVETRETMREAAEIAWANYGYTNENLGWFAVVDAVLALVPKAVMADLDPPTAPDQRLEILAACPAPYTGENVSRRASALHSLLSELLTRVAALERKR